MVAMSTITFSIPGVAYYECLDPRATEMESAIGLPEPVITRAGRGLRVTYENVSPALVRETGEHLHDMGHLWLANSDPEYDKEERARYRTLVKVGKKLIDQADRAEAEAVGVKLGAVIDGKKVTKVGDKGVIQGDGQTFMSWLAAMEARGNDLR